MLKIRRIVGLIVLVGLVSTIGSCPIGRYKYYSYPTAKEITDFGVVRARLMGAYKKVSQDETVLSSPYRLVVSAEIDLVQMGIGESCVLHIDEIIMTALDTGKIEFLNRNHSDPFVPVGDNAHLIAGFDRELPEIPYADYDIGVELSIAGCKSEVSTRRFRFVIKKDYSEGEETVWDFFRNL
jgi:hypothetical protein